MTDKPKFANTWFYASLATYEVNKLIGSETKHTERQVDFDQYAERLTKAYEELDANGYDVINVVPIAMGQSEHCNQRGGAYVGDVGFSITRGAVVIGKRRD